MSASFRELRPMPSQEGGEQADPQSGQHDLPTRRRKHITGACRDCRDKKTRCSGERPACAHCRARGVECVYEFLPGETRTAWLRSRNERVESDLHTMMELYWYLQTRTKEEAARAVAVIQSGAEPGQVLASLDVERSHDAPRSASDAHDDRGPGAGAHNRDEPSGDARGGSAARQQHLDPSGALLQGEKSGSNRGTEPSLLGRDSPTVQSAVSEAMFQPSNTIAALESGVEAFFSCTGCIFHIYGPSEARELLDAARPRIEEAGEHWPRLIFRGSAPVQLKASLCSVFIMAAVGLQYTKDAIPALEFEPSAGNGTHQYVNIFYEFARHLLEAVIENSVLEAIKVCAAMCVFNTIGHATIALANADMGINFAFSLGPGFQRCPAGLSEEVWVNHKRVTRTLVTLRNWLVTTLGFVPGDNPSLQGAIHLLIDQKDLAPNEVIQQELAKRHFPSCI